MLIKLTSINAIEKKGYDFTQIVGTRIDDGSEWKKDFFSNNTKVLSQLGEFGIGDNINVKMVEEKKNNKTFWNVSEITAATDAIIEKVKGSAPGGVIYEKNNSGSQGKSNWTPDPNKDRGVSLRYAIDTMPIIRKDEDLKKMLIADFTKDVMELQNIYVDLMNGNDPFSNPDGNVKSDEDPLGPPEV